MWARTDGAWTRLAAMLMSFMLLCALFSVKNQFPTNLIVLFSFTGLMSYTIGIMCTAYAAAGMGLLVLEAFAITSLVFVGLTIFAIKSKIDFSFLGAILRSACSCSSS